MNITTNNVEVSTPFFHENNTVAMNATRDNSSMEPTHLQEGGVWGRAAEGGSVSPSFFHENNTAVMNIIYESPATTAVQSEAGLVQSDPSENTFAYVLQTSISQIIRMKEYYEVCACGYQCFAAYGSIMCKAILNKTAEEYEKLLKSEKIVTQHIRPMDPWETENTDPVPWRWANRTAALLEGGVWGRAAEGGSVSPQERGACLLYRPVTYMHAFDKHNFDHRTIDRYTFDPRMFNQHVIDQHMSRQTPSCFLRENDVVDNGTVMCLRAVGNECIYGNETMKAMLKAMLKFEGLYQPKIASETSWAIVFAFLVMIVVGAFNHKPK